MTVSPNPSRYDGFKKNSRVPIYYFPCHSENELLAICKYVREAQPGIFDYLTDEVVKDRINNVGPFLRYILCSEADWSENVVEERDNAVNNLNLADLTSIEDKNRNDKKPPSHRVLKCVVIRDGNIPYYKMVLDFSSPVTAEKIKMKISQLTGEDCCVSFCSWKLFRSSNSL